jgi:hypothetical protein
VSLLLNFYFIALLFGKIFEVAELSEFLRVLDEDTLHFRLLLSNRVHAVQFKYLSLGPRHRTVHQSHFSYNNKPIANKLSGRLFVLIAYLLNILWFRDDSTY